MQARLRALSARNEVQRSSGICTYHCRFFSTIQYNKARLLCDVVVARYFQKNTTLIALFRIYTKPSHVRRDCTSNLSLTHPFRLFYLALTGELVVFDERYWFSTTRAIFDAERSKPFARYMNYGEGRTRCDNKSEL